MELAGVGHEAVEGLVRIVFAVTQRVVGTVRQRVRIGAAPATLSGGGDRHGEIFDPRARAVIGRIVRTQRESAGGVEAVDPAPESEFGIDFDWPVGSILIGP